MWIVLLGSDPDWKGTNYARVLLSGTKVDIDVKGYNKLWTGVGEMSLPTPNGILGVS